MLRTRAFSPRSTRLAETRSQPRVPLPAMMKGWAAGLVDWKSLRVREMVSPKTLTKPGAT